MVLQNASTHHLSFLSVCRQVHSETALLPFMLNTFRLASLHTLCSFKIDLTHAQRCAITKIQVCARLDSKFGIRMFLRTENLRLAVLLPNLRLVIVEVARPHTNSFPSFRYKSISEMHTQIEKNRKLLNEWLLGGNKDKVSVAYSDLME